MIDIFSKTRIFIFYYSYIWENFTIFESKPGFSPIIYGHSY